MKLSIDAQPITLTQILWIVVVIVFLVQGSAAWYYHSAYKSKSETLVTLQQSVANQKNEAALKLKALTAERDKKQAALNKLAKDQEKVDAIAKGDIKRLNDQLVGSTVRVRVMPTVQRCGSTASDQATAAANCAADETETSGVLPEANTRRLADALTEVETLSAAYNSCRAIELPP